MNKGLDSVGQQFFVFPGFYAIQPAHADNGTVPCFVTKAVTLAQAVVIIPFPALFVCFYNGFYKHVLQQF
jgi:hypothetical protein